MAATDKLTLYSFVGSQWAGVPWLGLVEKGYTASDYDIEEIDLGTAENFEPGYLQINPHGTVPSLTGPSLQKPLVDSVDILEYLDRFGPSKTVLKATSPQMQERMQQLIDLVHSDQVGTNLILLQARSQSEMEAKRASPWRTFVLNRQAKLEECKSKFPEHPFYGPKAAENGVLFELYTTDVGPEHQKHFEATHRMYQDFAAGLDKLENLLVLPYAAGDSLTAADLHIVPWLAHAMWGAGGNEIYDFKPLENLIQQSVSSFKIGAKTKKWWENMSKRQSFQEVYRQLH